MVNVVLAIHLMIALAIIGLVLLQKTDSSAMGGMGGGVSMNNLTRPRSRPNPLTRATTFMGIAFFATSLGLAVIAKNQAGSTSILDLPSSEGAAVPSVSESVQVPTESSSESAAPLAPNLAPNLAPDVDPSGPAVPTE